MANICVCAFLQVLYPSTNSDFKVILISYNIRAPGNIESIKLVAKKR